MSCISGYVAVGFSENIAIFVLFKEKGELDYDDINSKETRICRILH